MSMKPSSVETMDIPKLDISVIDIEIEGDSALICHRWSEKAKKEMRDKQMKKAKNAKEARNPEADFQSSLYPHPEGGYGFPAIAFKASAVTACTSVGNMTKVAARQAFHVVNEYEMVKIKACEPTAREDMVRVGMGTADLRYRGEFKKWSAMLKVRFNSSVISKEQLYHIFNTAGFAVGVGEWRPEKDGMYGMFHVVNE